jgi:D-tyrosyl-tRNA(Tyr) deacylase
MRAVVQRVAWAEVEAEGRIVGRIEEGLLVYVGVGTADAAGDTQWLAAKVANLRVFKDSDDKLNLCVREVGGAVLAVSNFTLLGDARKGRRPAFVAAAPAKQAEPMHEAFLAALRAEGVPVATGVFGAMMRVRSEAAGPVNIVLDSPATQHTP